MSLETMTKLASTTVGVGGTASIQFTNIPQNYTDLVIKLSARTTEAYEYGSFNISFNSSSIGFTGKDLYYVYPNTGSANRTTTYYFLNGASATANTFCNAEIYIPNYTSSNNKSFSMDGVTENNGNLNNLSLSSGLWSNPTAISSISITPASTMVQHSTATLYGIKNSAQTAGNSIKATGGNIVFDGTYVYHVFPSSGSFVATQPILADVISVGAGGGGGWNNAGGGGGGEVDISKNLSISAYVSNTVTVGAGGSFATSQAGPGSNGGTSSFSNTVTSLGGGGGGPSDATNTAHRSGQTGGSGGGASIQGTGGTASGSNTNIGGNGFGTADNYQGGGGGGATSAGSNAVSAVAGAGGQGMSLASIFSGFNLGNITHFGSGGGGGGYRNSSMTRGLGGTNGGNGAMESTSGNFDPTSGTANSGGGGGGGAYTGVNSRNGASGGSGIVIVRYKG